MADQLALLDAILESVRDGVILGNGQGQLLRVNRAVAEALGFAEETLYHGDGHAARAREIIECALLSGEDWSGLISCGDGQYRRFALIQTPLVADRRCLILQPMDPVGMGDEIIPGDALTELPTRTIFMDRVERAIVHVNRSGGSVALLIMGLDRFTLVNDALGFDAGDRLLIEVAQRLKHCIRETDTVARLDGDRFALVMAITATGDSVIVAEKVLHAVQEPFPLDGQDIVVTFSIGIAIYPQDAQGASELVGQGEKALHHAKLSGRNQYQFFSTDMNVRARQRLELETRMRGALQRQEFVVFYQPKVRAEDGLIVGAEALVRWRDPERGIISPGVFIPVAEETGLIEELGAWVLRRTCLDIGGWQQSGLPYLRVSVNVSARQFRSRTFVETVSDILCETRLQPRWIELEITESILMHDVENVIGKMVALRELGVGLSIDDFGTGYSSLSYLVRFPITTLKIDRAFIADVERNPKTAEIARAIIGLSRGLNLEVVAEGAELAEQVEFLRENGCETVQGFYYSKPVPEEEFALLLASGRIIRD